MADRSHQALANLEREQDDRLSLTLPKGKFWQPNAEQAIKLADIIAYCAQEGVTADELAASTMNKRTHKPRDASSWIKITRGNLEAGNRTALFDDFVQAFTLVYKRRELRKQGGVEFVPTAAYRLLKAMVATANARQGIGSAERLVLAVGDTGKGKSWAIEAMILEHGNGVMIHGNEVWKCSYKAVLMDVCDKVGIAVLKEGKKGKAGREKTMPELRRDLMADLKHNRRTLVFEEIDQECLTASLVKLWMTLCNETLATVVLAINPDALDAIRRLGLSGTVARAEGPERMADSAAQLLRRGRQVPFAAVEAVVPQTLLTQELGKVDGINEAAAMLAEAGALGGYSLVTEVVKDLTLAGLTRLTEEAVEGAIAAYHSRFRAGCMSRALPVRAGRPGVPLKKKAA